MSVSPFEGREKFSRPSFHPDFAQLLGKEMFLHEKKAKTNI